MKSNDTKRSQLAVMGALALLAACATTTQAGDVSAGWYMSTDAGINLMQDLQPSGSMGKVSLDPGVRWSLSAGYGFKLAPKLTLGVEMETGILYNSLRSVSAGGASASLGGDYYQIPLLANLVLNYHAGKWVPYIGFGGGMNYTAISINSVGSVPVSSLGNETDPAIEGEAGIRYQLSNRSELGLGYKFLGVLPTGLNLVQNHSFSLTYAFHF